MANEYRISTVGVEVALTQPSKANFATIGVEVAYSQPSNAKFYTVGLEVAIAVVRASPRKAAAQIIG